jgi:hypothetical protein
VNNSYRTAGTAVGHQLTALGLRMISRLNVLYQECCIWAGNGCLEFKEGFFSLIIGYSSVPGRSNHE